MLKEIRKQIALANDIEFVTAECKHKGDCAGACPKCESEVAYLEEQLARRRRLGFTTRVVGLSLGIAAIAPALFTSCEGPIIKGRLQGDVPAPETERTSGIIDPEQEVENGQGEGQGEGQE